MPNKAVTCTFNNTQKGQLIVKKETDPNGSAKSFTFTPTGWNGGNTFPLADGEQKASGDLAPGDYSVAETVPAGWDLSNITCDKGNPRQVDSKVTVTVAAGQTVTCTFNNTQKGQLIVKKETDPNGSAKSFTFTPTGWNGGKHLPAPADGEQKASGDLAPGDYSVAETVPAGWDLSNITCDKGNPRQVDSKVTVTVAAGQTVTCTFNNTHKGS